MESSNSQGVTSSRINHDDDDGEHREEEKQSSNNNKRLRPQQQQILRNIKRFRPNNDTHLKVTTTTTAADATYSDGKDQGKKNHAASNDADGDNGNDSDSVIDNIKNWENFRPWEEAEEDDDDKNNNNNNNKKDDEDDDDRSDDTSTTKDKKKDEESATMSDSSSKDGSDDENNENENNDVEDDVQVDEATAVQNLFQYLESVSRTPLQKERLNEKKMVKYTKHVECFRNVVPVDFKPHPIWSRCLFMETGLTKEGLKAYYSIVGAMKHEEQKKKQILLGLHRIISHDYMAACMTCMIDPNKPLDKCVFSTYKYGAYGPLEHLKRRHEEVVASIPNFLVETGVSKRINRNKNKKNVAAERISNTTAGAPAVEDNTTEIVDHDSQGIPSQRKNDNSNEQPKATPRSGGRNRKDIQVDDITAFRAAALEMESLIGLGGRHGVPFPSVMNDILERKNIIIAVLNQHFEGAMSISEVWNTAVQPVVTKYGLTATNTWFADSICPEHQEEGTPVTISDRFIQFLAPGQKQRQEAYPLGGLAGIPFAGPTGFEIFSSNIPTTTTSTGLGGGGGCHHAFVLQASHIGLAADGRLGKYACTNSNNYGDSLNDFSCSANVDCCGGAIGAYTRCCAARNSEQHDNDDNAEEVDFQMAYLTRELSKKVDAIVDSNGDEELIAGNASQAELARQTHLIGKSMLDKIVNTDFGDRQQSLLFILTGIQINLPEEFEEDYFLLKSFVIYKKYGRILDLLVEDDNNVFTF